MNLTAVLEPLGLSASHTAAYELLLKSGELTPPELAKQAGLTRTNAYMILQKLEELGLAESAEVAKKLRFTPTDPANLEKLAAKQRETAMVTEAQVKNQMSKLLGYYYSAQKEPGLKFYSGKDSLIEVYKDHLRTKEDVYFVRTPSDEEYFGPTLYKYMEKRAKAGITAHGLAPYTAERKKYSRENDKYLKRVMTWVPEAAYDAPVEISIYGNKVAYLSFGDETTAMIIESPQIAKAMRQLFQIAQSGSARLMRKSKA